MGDHDSVNEPGVAYQEMYEAGQWELLEDLQSTPTMRRARTRRLPKFDGESTTDYEARLKLGYLYPFFRRTVNRLVSKPYSKPVTWHSDSPIPERIAGFLEDIDGAGTSTTQFSRAWFQNGVKWGLGHALVDFTPIELNLGDRKATRGEEMDAGVRPAAVRIAPPNLIDWQHERRNGEDVLVEIRYRGKRTVREGFAQKTIHTVTHYTDTFSQVYTSKDGQGEWTPEAVVPHTFGRVPLEPWYAARTGVMTAEPPLLELAETNADHWQMMADYKVGLYLTSQDRFVVTGITKTEMAQIGAHSVKKSILMGNPEARAQWVSNEGKGVAVLAAGLQKAEDRAAELSARPTSREKSPITATGEVSQAQDSTCDLLAWVDSQEDGLLRVTKLAAEWLGETLPEDFTFQIHRGFTIGPESRYEIEQLQKDAKEGRVSNAVYLREAQRRGLYSDDIDPDDESEAAATESATRALALLEGDGEDPGDGAAA